MKERAVRWGEVVSIVRHWWWVLAVVTLLIGGLSVGRWLRTPPVYEAERSVAIAVAPDGMPTGQQSYLAEQQAQAAARAIVSPAFLTAPVFDQALSRAAATATDASLRRAKPLALGSALSASHTSSTVTLRATWSSAAGAEALATIAANLLAQGGPPVMSLLPAGTGIVRSVAVGVSAPAIHDPAQVASARNALLTRLALALLAGILVMMVIGLLERRQSANEVA